MKKSLAVVLIILFIFISGFGLFKISKSRTWQFFGGLINRVETEDKVVALTFDDGPTDNTDQVLKILDQLEVKVTFFVTGRELEANLAEGKKIVAAGHELGNHSYSHPRLVLKSPAYIKEEVTKTDRLIRKAGYQGEIQFRPPYCKKLFLLPYYLKQQNRKTILWELEPESYPQIAANDDKIVDYVINNVRPGSIILLHVMYDSRQESIEAISGIVKELRKREYQFKTVSELLET